MRYLEQHDGKICYDLGDDNSCWVVESKRAVLGQDRSASERVGDFRKGDECVVQDREKQGTALQEEAGGIVGGIVEEGTSKKSLDDCCTLLHEQGRLVSPHNLVLSDSGCLDLSVEVGGNGRLCRYAFVLLASNHLFENSRVVCGLRCFGIGPSFFQHLGIDSRSLVGVPNRISSARKDFLVARGNNSLLRNRYTSQEISSIRATVSQKAKVFHERYSISLGSVEDLLALVKNKNLVKVLVDAIARLIQCNNGGETENVRHDPDGLNPLKSSTGVKASGRVVPAEYTSASG
ncbi:hypothetical protein HG530_008361 [Fusarium avenaceum]|nr:hypothetical protein HG530_008361 [Fusarium avenaceum]